ALDAISAAAIIKPVWRKAHLRSYVPFGNSWYKNANETRKYNRSTAARLSSRRNAMNLRIAGFIVIAVAAFGIQAQAHHSFAMFDHEKIITVSGTLKEFEW